MLTKILCTECGEVLRPGEPGATTEFKTCISCITQSSTTPNPDIQEAREKIKREINDFTTRLKSITVELCYKPIDDEICLVMEFFDFTKRKIMEFGFTKDKLTEFINHIDEITEEHKE